MAVEEITLHPVSLAKNASPEEPVAEEVPEALDPLIEKFAAACRSRDSFALTARSRQRNRERFQQALKSLVKTMATRGSARVRDRDSRMIIRTEIYTHNMSLVQAMAHDHLRLLRRGRSACRWAAALTFVGVSSLLITAVLNGWIAVPL